MSISKRGSNTPVGNDAPLGNNASVGDQFNRFEVGIDTPADDVGKPGLEIGIGAPTTDNVVPVENAPVEDSTSSGDAGDSLLGLGTWESIPELTIADDHDEPTNQKGGGASFDPRAANTPGSPGQLLTLGTNPDGSHFFTGNRNVDATLIGSKWGTTNLTFSFPTSGSNYNGDTFDSNGVSNYHTVLGTVAQAAARAAFAQLSAYTGLTFTEITDTDSVHANIRISQTADADVPSAYGNFPSDYKAVAGDIWFGKNNQPYYDLAIKGTWGFSTMMHEIGHTMGLKHGHQDYTNSDLSFYFGTTPRFGSQSLTPDRDGQAWSLMTYTPAPFTNSNFAGDKISQPQSYMQYDLAALQYMYGANFNTNNGDTVYTFSQTTGEMFVNGVGQGAPSDNRILLTIWDGGGTDTIDASNYANGVTIDLRPGEFSTFDPAQLANHLAAQNLTALAPGNIAMSLLYNNDARSLIENATGGIGNDIFVGNIANNVLDGGAGSDTVIFTSTTGVNVTLNDSATDVIVTHDGETDTLRGIENIGGTSGNDTITGNSQDNVLTGGSGGTDVLSGGGGNDRLIGGGFTVTTTYSAPSQPDITKLGTTNNGSIGTAMATAGFFDVDANPDITNATSMPHATINATAFGGVVEYYRIDVTVAGSQAIFDIDGGGTLDDSILELINSGGTVLASNDTGTGDASPPGHDDAYLTFTFTTVGTYYIRVGRWTGTSVAQPLLAGQTYQLNISLDNAAAVTTTVTANNTSSLVADGGEGNDVVVGTIADDTLTGGNDNDTASFVNAFNGGSTTGVTVDLNLQGAAQNTVAAGNDTLAGFENLIGSALNDTLTGDGNDNFIEGGLGNDTLVGGLGSDTASYAGATAGVTVSLALQGSAQSTGNAGADTLSGFENLAGSGFNDSLTGDANANTLSGGAGNDTLNPGANASGTVDLLDGGLGSDTASFAGYASGVTATLAGASDGAATAGGAIAILRSIENLTGSANADTLTGDDNDNAIEGGLGNDTLTGGLGVDTLVFTGSTAVTVNLATVTAQATGWGSDTITGFENVRTGSGTDNITGDGNDNIFFDGGGNDTYNGAGGIDTVDYSAATSGVGVNLATLTAQNTTGGGTDTITNIENVVGSATAGNVLQGSAAGNRLTGGAAADTIVGNLGIDFLFGGAGNDILIGGQNGALDDGTADTLEGGAGNDFLGGGQGSDILRGGDGDDTLVGGIVNNLNQFFTNDGGDDTYEGGNGSDRAIVVYGDRLGVGASTVGVAFDIGNIAGNSAITYNGVNVGSMTSIEFVTFRGSSVNDVVRGGGSLDSLLGLGGDDTLDGWIGNDILEGGLGNDTLIGGEGLDTASYSLSTAGVTVDLRIAGAQNTVGAGTDTLSGIEYLTASGFGDTLHGSDVFNLIVDSVVSGAAGQTDSIFGYGGNDSILVTRAAAAVATNINMDGGDGDDFIELRGGTLSAALATNAAGLVAASNGASQTYMALGTTSNDRNLDVVTVDGGAGNDRIVLSGVASATINAGSGADIVSISMRGVTSVNNYQLTLGAGADIVQLGGTSAEVAATARTNRVTDFDRGDAGDKFEWSAYLNGGLTGYTANSNAFASGHLRLTQSGSDLLVQVDRDAGGVTNVFVTVFAISNGYTGGFTAFNFDGFIGNLTLTGIGSLDETITGATGNDVLSGGDGNDVLIGLAGTDTLDGGNGTDVLDGGTGNDTLIGNAGTDTALYVGVRADYNVVMVTDANGRVTGFTTVTDTNLGNGNEGADTLSGVEVLDFADVNLNLTDPVQLFDASGNLVGTFTTIQAAIDAAGTNYRIEVGAGTYAEHLTIGVQGLTIEGVPGAVLMGTFLTDNGVSGDLNVWLKTAAAYTGVAGVGVTIAADGVTISGLTISAFLQGILLGNGTDFTTLNDVILSHNFTGVHKPGSAAVTNFTMNDGSIVDGHLGMDIVRDPGSGGIFDIVKIDGTSFADLNRKGIYVEALSHAELLNIVMTNVGEFGGITATGALGAGGNGINLNLKYGDYTTILIEGFTLTNVGSSDRDGAGASHQNGGAIIITVRDDAPSYSGNPATLTGVIIRNGTIDGTSTGIEVGEPGKNNATPDVLVEDVSILNAVHNALHGDVGNQSAATLTLDGTSGGDSLIASGNSDGALIVRGLAGNDTITTGSGADTITGGANDDILDGAGGYDSAIYSGNRSDYLVTLLSPGVIQIQDLRPGTPDGTDQLTGIERIVFADDDYSVNPDGTLSLINFPPVAVDDVASATEDGSVVNGSVATNDSDPDPGETATLAYSLNAPVAGLTLNPNGGYSFDPSNAAYQHLAAGATVNVVATYTVTDDNLATDTGTLTITVTGTNDAPVITGGTATGSVTEAVSLDGIRGADQTANNRLEPVVNYDSAIVSLLAAHPNDMHAVLVGLQAQLPSGSGFAEAIAIVWDYVDDNFSYYNTVINEISARLSVEYALYLQGGGGPLTGTAAKYTPDGGDLGTAPDRYQSLHDNILGNVNGAGLIDKFLDSSGGGSNGPPNGTADQAAYDRIIQLLADNGLSDLVNRPVYSGTEGAPNLSLAYDQANGLLAPATGGQLTATDVDDGAVLTWSGSAIGVYGAFSIAANGAWTYALDQFDPDTQALGAGESAVDTFTATVSDGLGGTATQLVTITVFGTNDAPVGVATAMLPPGSEDVVYHVTSAQLLAGFTDLDGDTLSVLGLSADHGTVVAEPGGFAITLDPDYYGPVVLSYQVDDGNGGSTSAVQTFDVNGAPDVTGPVSASATEGGGTYIFNPLANASDPDGDSLVVIPVGPLPAGVSFVGGSAATIDFSGYALGSVVGQHGWTDATPSSPDNAIVDVSGNRMLRLANDPTSGDFGGPFSPAFAISAGEGGAAADTLTFSFVVRAVNNVADGSRLEIDLGSSDRDDRYNFMALEYTAGGLRLVQNTPLADPDGNWQSNNFNWGGNVQLGALLDASVSHTIQVIFRAVDGSNNDIVEYYVDGMLVGTGSTFENLAEFHAGQPHASAINSVNNVLFRAGDPAGNPFPADGPGGNRQGFYIDDLGMSAFDSHQLQFNASDPAYDHLVAGATELVTVNYNVADGHGGVTPASTVITVTGTNDNASIAGTATGAAVESGVGPGNTPFPGTPSATGMLTVTDVDDGEAELVPVIAGTAGANGYGTFAVAADGNWTYTLNNADTDTNALALGATVTDTILVYSEDLTASQVITVTITGTNDAPVAVADTNGGDPVVEAGLNPGNTPFAGDPSAAGNVLTNDTDVDTGDTRSVSAVAGGAVGAPVIGVYGSLVINANGSYFYTLNNADGDTNAIAQGATASDVFTYTIVDLNGATSSTTLTITITGTNDGPVAVADTNSGDAVIEAGVIPGDAIATGNVLANDTDVDTADTRTVSEVNGSGANVGNPIVGTYGSVTIAADGSYTYTLNNADGDTNALVQGATVTELFTYMMVDANGATSSSTLTITITGTNDAAVIGGNTSVNLIEAGGVQAALSATGTLTIDDPDSGQNSFVAVPGTVGTYGTFAMNSAGAWTYTASSAHNEFAAGVTYTDTFTVASFDGTTQVVTINITGTNDAPVAGNDAVSATEDGAIVTGNVGTNDSDVDIGDTRTYTLLGPVTGLIFHSNGSYSFDASSYDSLAAGSIVTLNTNYRVTDSNGGIDTATLTITITGINDAPDAANDIASATEDAIVTGTVVINDNDIDFGDTRTYALNAPVAGLTLDSDGNYSFDAGSYDSLAFGATQIVVATYTLTDGQGATDTATLTITVTGVNDGPDAVDDVNSATEDGAIVTGNVATNDSDADAGDTRTYALDAPVAGLILHSNGSYSFDPSSYDSLALGATQIVVAAYTMTDGQGATDTATLTITVTGVNDGPDAANDVSSATEDGAIVTGNVATNDSDADAGDTRAYTLNAPVAGLTLALDGSYSFDPASYDSLAFGATQIVVATYTMTDGQGATDTATLTITVTGINDAPDAANDTASATEDGAVVFGTVAANDSDADAGDTRTYALDAPVAGLTLDSSGSYSFDPASYDSLAFGATQIVVATYTMTDGQGATDTATLTITVTGVNDGPDAVNDVNSATEDGAIVTGTVATNDSDADVGDTRAYTLNAPVAGLTLALDGSYSFDPASYDSLAFGATQTVVATYTLTDGQGATDTATLTITVTGVNDGPDAADDVNSATEDGAIVTGNVATNDSDADAGDTRTYALDAPVAGLILHSNGSYSFDPSSYDSLALGATQIVVASYTMTDGQGATDTATLTITVTGVNDGPDAANDVSSATEDGAIVTGTVATNDSDADAGDTRAYTLNAPVAGLTLALDGSYSFDPASYDSLALGATQTVVATYTMTDGQGVTDTATLTITVTGINDAPDAVDDVHSATEDGAIVTGNVATNDSDADAGDTRTYALNAPVAGLTFDSSGSYSFDPSSYDSLALGATQIVVATYTMTDGQGVTDTATLTITVTGVDDAAVAQPDAFVTNEATSVAGSVFANNGSGADSDVDGPLVISAVNGSALSVGTQITLASGALLTLNADGTFTYVPNGAFDWTPTLGSGASNTPASDSFTYTVAGGNTVTVHIAITGLDTNDTLFGTAGADTLSGGAGNDVYIVDQMDDLVLEAAGKGNDMVLTSVSYILSSNQEIETLSTRTHASTDDVFLTGNQLNNTLIGNAGDNLINGVDGADVMIGLAGDDTYVIDNLGDLVVDLVNQGNDLVYTYLSHTLTNGNEIETLSTVFQQGTDAINLGGSDYDNTLIGNYGANYINGNGGADTMIGLNGDDTYVADDVGDVVQEAVGGGSDVLFTFASHVLMAGQEVEAISTAAQGATTAINLTGNEFGQIIVGNAGTNLIDGKGGNDSLYGLAGADTFAFTTALGAGNVDTLADFVAGTDKIALDDALFAGIGSPGAFNAGAFVIGAAAGDANDRIVYNSATGQLFYDADGNGAGAAILFATLQGAPSLGASDFQVI